MKSGSIKVLLFLFCQWPLAFGSVSIIHPTVSKLGTRNPVFCPRCVVLKHDSLLPGRIVKQVFDNGEWLPSFGRRNAFEKNAKTLVGGLLVAQGLYDSKQIKAQLQNKTYKYLEDASNRFFYSLHHHLADYMNYSLEIKIFYRNTSSKNDVQSIDALKSEEIDLTISPIVTLARKTDDLFVSFLPAFQTVSYDVVFKQPRRIQSSQALILQLRPEVWLCIGGLGVFSAATLYTIQKIFTTTHSSSYNEFSVSECVLVIISAFAQQGIPITPANISGRIVCAFVLILGLMISTYYNAATVNALLTHATKSIQTIEQIVASGRQILFLNDSMFHESLTRSMVIPEKLWLSLPSRHTVNEIDKGLKSVLKGDGLCGERIAIYAGIHQVFNDLEKCDASFIMTSIPLLARSYIRRDLPYREKIVRGSLRLKEHGLIDRQYRHWFPPKPECTANPTWASVDLTVTAIAMAIVVFGLVASFVFFLFELTFQALSQATTKRKEHSQ